MLEILKTVLAWWFLWVAVCTVTISLVFAIGMMLLSDENEDKRE